MQVGVFKDRVYLNLLPQIIFEPKNPLKIKALIKMAFKNKNLKESGRKGTYVGGKSQRDVCINETIYIK